MESIQHRNRKKADQLDIHLSEGRMRWSESRPTENAQTW